MTKRNNTEKLSNRRSDPRPHLRYPSVIGYARVSTPEQANEGISIAAQESTIRSYCKLMGLDLAELIVDEAISGSVPLPDRAGGFKLMESLQPGMGIVAVKLDRIFRDCLDALSVVREWDRHDCALHLCDLGGAPINTKSPTGRLFLTMLAGFAELERNQIGERTRTALQHKKRSGDVYARIPFGFRRRGSKLLRHDQEQKTIKIIQRMRRAGKSLQEIATRLNREKVKTKRGATWHPSTVKYILENDLHK